MTPVCVPRVVMTMPKFPFMSVPPRRGLVALISVAVAWAQTPTGEILGTVLDPTGAVVSGAVITITNTSTGVERKLATNSAGVYTAPAPVSRYLHGAHRIEGIPIEPPFQHR